MKKLFRILIFFLLLLPISAEAARVLTAKDPSTGRFYQRVDSGEKSETKFAAEVAAQFGVPLFAVEVVVENLPSAQIRNAEISDGTFDGKAVNMAPASIPTSAQLKKTAARNKLRALGLTDEDLKALGL